MLGWINDCVEKLVLSKFGLEAWHTIKEKAGCDVPDGGFYKLDVYTDQSTVDLVVAAVEVSGLTMEVVLETFGAFFVEYVKDEGYENLLVCQGSNLKDFMANINAMHGHLQSTFPKKMTMPQFWVEDHESGDGSLLLHYHSKRGSLLAPVAKGVIVEIASTQFGYDIEMERLRTQGEDGAEITSWRIVTVDAKDMWKLTMKEELQEGADKPPTSVKCPFTGMTFVLPSQSESSAKARSGGCPYSDGATTATHLKSTEGNGVVNKKRKAIEVPTISPTKRKQHCDSCSSTASDDDVSDQDTFDCSNPAMVDTDMSNARITSSACVSVSSSSVADTNTRDTPIGLSGTVTRSLFPYHVMVDSELRIAQVGNKLPAILQSTEEDLMGCRVADLFVLTKPSGVEWNWKWLQLLEDQAFEVEPAERGDDAAPITFKTTVTQVSESPPMAMLVMTPEARNLEELRDMKLTFSDLPVHGAHRDSIFLREHLSSQMNSALKMEKLSRSLKKEKSLLESLLPTHAAEGLRQGKTVEPRLHSNATFFFSDIVNFTEMCDQLYPWQVVETLNRLFCVLDYLAKAFNLYKVETVGDAYVCCSGLPQADEDHAKNVANFAVAVRHCCRHVLSPVDGSPMKLRIGINSGPCASGVVGTTSPRYCVFGDNVNTASRHESSGLPGKIHCSRTTHAELQSQCIGSFVLQERGVVSMKGKGDMVTYWLEAHEGNELVNRAALIKLDAEIKDLLQRTNFKSHPDQTDVSIADVAMEIQNERKQRRDILKGKRSLSTSQLMATMSHEDIRRIGSLNRDFRKMDRASMELERSINFSWGEPPTDGTCDKGPSKQSRCGNSLLDVVDRCRDATAMSDLPMQFPATMPRSLVRRLLALPEPPPSCDC